MNKTSKEQLAAIKQYLKQNNRFENKTVSEIRQQMAASAAQIPHPDHVTIRKEKIGELIAEWIIPENLSSNEEKQAIIYYHGGGFIAGTCEAYRDLGARIATAGGIKVLIVEYRLAPEHLYPAANEDCLSTYRRLIEDGYKPSNLILGGDSVGASLALMTLLSLRDNSEEMPAGAFLLSPHSDLVHLDGESYRTRAELDPTGSLEANTALLDAYLGGHSHKPIPLLSPLRMDLSGLPPLLIQAGNDEVLLSDAIRLADRARAVDVTVELEIWEDMWSVFQLLAYMLPEAQQAIHNIGRFVRTVFQRTGQA
ncbi:hydrolase [Paenibacillus radicis (ex Gao et al. 2016)]|uniref:Hydrolase n=2 Tax=Paenibacillus radicis (ex Gao et al. 2016) TaxID=1737354 RepID=A0A917HF99_9BACL|nr:hydrolase [Paenibacillus radicis (ex Gao et al. 2016)]